MTIGQMPIQRDERVPPPGTELTWLFKGYGYRVTRPVQVH